MVANWKDPCSVPRHPRLGFVIWQKQEHFRQAMLWVWQECRLFLGNTGIRVAEFQRPDGW